MTPEESETIISLSLLAALSDGHLGQEERESLRALSDRLGLDAGSHPPLPADVDIRALAARLSGTVARREAFEACVAVCHADGIVTQGEESFLRALWPVLGLDARDVQRIQGSAQSVTEAATGSLGGSDRATKRSDDREAAPSGPEAVEPDRDFDGWILRHAMLAAAAEFLPGSLSSLAVIPIQMRLVARIGAAHGHALNGEQLQELLATAGIGATAQLVDGLARRLVGGVARSLGGRWAGGAAGVATSATFTFAATYGIGHASLAYYAGGRTLQAVELRALYTRLTEEGKTLYPRMEGEVRALAERLDLNQLMRSLKSGMEDLVGGVGSRE